VDLNRSVSKVLRYGVVLSAAIVAAGVLLLVASPPVGTPSSLQAMLDAGFGKPTLDASALVSGIAAANPVSLLQLGALVLFATPLARVAVSLLIFLRKGDSLYVGITLLVLAMLLFAIFVIGPTQA